MVTYIVASKARSQYLAEVSPYCNLPPEYVFTVRDILIRMGSFIEEL